MVTPATSTEPVALNYFVDFLKSCENLKSDPEFPCDPERIYAINIHAYECNDQVWINNYRNKGFQEALIKKIGSYGGRDWRSLIMSKKIWLTETTCNWDADFRKEQTQGKFVRSNKESCLRATGQREGFGEGSLATLSSMNPTDMERFAWWTLYLDPTRHTDVESITDSSLNRIYASRLFDDDYELTPVGRAFFQAADDPSQLNDVDCESMNHYLAHHYRCEFTLRGENGTTWTAVRKSLRDDDCQMAAFSVKLNNPKATVIGKPNKIFVGADHGLADKNRTSAHTQGYYWQCRFELSGDRGARWWVYRNTDVDDQCARAQAQVSSSNPGAKIISGPIQVFVGGDNGFENPHSEVYKRAEYWECEFTLVGKSGATWTSIRRTDIDDNCARAADKVKASNSNAKVLEVRKIFSGLDF